MTSPSSTHSPSHRTHPTAAAKSAVSAVTQEMDAALATSAQREVLKRIDAQRERLHARRLALQQARALKDSTSPHVDAGAPLPVRLITFAKLHPVAVAAALGLALAAGPGKLIRLAGVVLPIVMRMRR